MSRTVGVPPVESTYPVRDGNLLRPWIDGVAAFGRICEAVDSAAQSVWATIAFLRQGFTMPDGRTLFEVLDAAVARGVDVRVLFWRPGPELAAYRSMTFWGSQEDRRWLSECASRVKIRWDEAGHGFCQHQKSWIVDAGTSSEVAFVGGINCNPSAVVERTHAEVFSTHDAYVELRGPSGTDVHHNFAQRWNAASGRLCVDGYWAVALEDQLDFPDAVSAPAGSSIVQVSRTMHGGFEYDHTPPPGGVTLPLDAGERSVLDQYVAAILSAERTIYVENQYLAEKTVIAALAAACARGVSVIAVVPSEPDGGSTQQGKQARARLGQHASFLLAALFSTNTEGVRRPVYIHDKLMIVDDQWATVGSANLHHPSLFGNAEINVSTWDATFARALRVDLFHEHLGLDTSAMSDVEAFDAFTATTDRRNTRGRLGPVRLDPLTY